MPKDPMRPSDKAGALGVEYLDGHRPVGSEVVREVHGCGGAAAEFPLDPITAGQSALEMGSHFKQWIPRGGPAEYYSPRESGASE